MLTQLKSVPHGPPNPLNWNLDSKLITNDWTSLVNLINPSPPDPIPTSISVHSSPVNRKLERYRSQVSNLQSRFKRSRAPMQDPVCSFDGATQPFLCLFPLDHLTQKATGDRIQKKPYPKRKKTRLQNKHTNRVCVAGVGQKSTGGIGRYVQG